MSKTECSICGVAYDVGKRACYEEECIRLVYAEHPWMIKVKDRKKYTNSESKKIDRVKSRYSNIVQRCKKKNLAIDISQEDIAALIERACEYCGVIDKIEVDRKDSTRGYTKDNIAPACRRCNTLKNNCIKYEEMKTIAEVLGWKKQ